MLTPEETVQALLRDVDRLILGGLKRELTTTLQEIETRLAADLAAAAAANGGTLDARFTTRRAQAFREQCRLATEYAQQRLAGVSAARSSKAVAASVAHVERVLGTFEADHRGLSMPLPILTAAQRTAAHGRAEASVLRQRQSSVQRYGTAMIGDFEEGIRLGLARGKTSGEVIANLISVSPPGLAARLAATEPRSFPDPKRGFVARQYWAERIVRTETANAQNEANQQAIVEAVAPFPDLKRKILAVGDKRTAEDSIYVHGQVRGPTEPFTDGAGRVYLRPPARPNDRETVIPWREAWAETKTTEKHDPPTLEELAERAERMRAAESKGRSAKAGGAVKAVSAKESAKAERAKAREEARAAKKARLEARIQEELAKMRTKAEAKKTKSKPTQTTAPVPGTLRDVTPDPVRKQAMLDALGRNASTRTATHELLERDYGIVMQPFARNGAIVFEDLGIDGPSAMARWTGEIAINSRMHASLLSSLRTVIHEELHHASRYVANAYRGAGAFIEEVTTEIGARVIARHVRGETPPLRPYEPGGVGSYQPQIARTVDVIANATGQPRAQAAAWVEEWSLRLKSSRFPVRTAGDAEQHVDNFVSTMTELTEAQRDAIRRDLLRERL